MTTAVITQPTYLPWLGYFELMQRADVFVFLDSVQFVRRSWHCRNRLKGTNGQPFWLTAPVQACPQDTPLSEIEISADQPRWGKDHLRSIQTHLGSAPYFHSLFPDVERWLGVGHRRLTDLTIAGIRMIAGLLGLSPRFVLASELDGRGHKSELLISLCRQVGADHYYSSPGSRVYMDEEMPLFDRAGIEVTFQSWNHPVYPQRGAIFISHLSSLDALAHIGPEATHALIQEGRSPQQEAA